MARAPGSPKWSFRFFEAFLFAALLLPAGKLAAGTPPPLPMVGCEQFLDELIHPRTSPAQAAAATEIHTHFYGILPPKELAKIFSDRVHSPDGVSFVRDAGPRGAEAFMMRRILEEAMGAPTPPGTGKTAVSEKNRPNPDLQAAILQIYEATIGRRPDLAEIRNPEFWKALDGKKLDALYERLLTGTAHARREGLRFDEAYNVLGFLRHDMAHRSTVGDESHHDIFDATMRYLANDRGIRHVEISQSLGLLSVTGNDRSGRRASSPLMSRRPPRDAQIDEYYLAGITNNFLRRPAEEAAREVEHLSSILGRNSRVLGVDILGGESNKFGPEAQTRLMDLYNALKGGPEKKYVLRIHAGEGLRESGRRETPQEVGRHNVEQVIVFAEKLKTLGVNFNTGKVVLRIAHATHASPEQIARLAKLGVHIEMLVGSNKATGLVPRIPKEAEISGKTADPLAAHPVLTALAMKAKVMLGADGDGVMATSVRAEYQLVRALVESYRDGNFKIAVIEGDKVVYRAYEELTDEMRTNIDKSIENMTETTKAYVLDVTGQEEIVMKPYVPPLQRKIVNLDQRKPKPKPQPEELPK